MFPFKPYYYGILLVLLLSIPAISSASEKKLATGVEKIRVLLFEQNPVHELLIFGYDGPVTISSSDFMAILQPGDTGARMTFKNGVISYEREGIRVESAHWTIETVESSLIRLLHGHYGWRYYKGNIKLGSNHHNGFRVINHVDLEDYVASVVGSEMNFDNIEALKAQAVISRTYALWNISLYHQHDYELNDHILNQVYAGELIFKPKYREATEATRGEVLMWSNKLIMAVYHSTCGGRTTSNDSVWSGSALPYLIGVTDNGSCAASPHRTWDFIISKVELHRLLRQDDFGVITHLKIAERDAYDRVTKMHMINGNKSTEISVNNLRLAINRQFGPLTLKSSYFTMEVSEDSYIFEGKGFGHGVGLCQWGAFGLAESGWNYSDILRFYYSGVDIQNYVQLEGDGFLLARF